MKFDIITIFPKILDSYINESILGRAQKKKFIKIKTHDLRKWADGKHKKVDDKPYGGGPGMLFKVEPIYKAVQSLVKNKLGKTGQSSRRKTKIILMSAKGKTFNQQIAKQLVKYERLVFICGRYEGVDERVAKHIAHMELSVGNYVLAGGELPAIMVVEAVSRLISGVLGKMESLGEESFDNKISSSNGLIENSLVEYPQYTRPEIFSSNKKTKWRVPKILISGNHKKIKEWRDSKR
ncbi:MAG: tRNA (guanosine(37)-N1)-methyltransferase TrmD [Candidatus Portnoybacteria bacterium CG10_big_fil_rev_8_21_14_0_10_36_7]|uniref:tRNA (guanine-N(1)-)-methyltransferase n=1 Tax=Candidatus Portnoybacteria bacterium CG10_big_fil_rev_8_21_14_0_10_36_7 TaxID=1974812 RepID=A0A2M8KEX1_9BACT|nr:MAG: tRNA (guanosine(37)-N1)-methyltransferase TrmD [Candidatus Portnoybacteria bacterium CG10_big_fil_rev_8_21_14_0_10_36_7]